MSSLLPNSTSTVQGRVHVFGSSKVISRRRLLASTRVMRSVILNVSALAPLKAFPIANAYLATSPASQTSTKFDYPGTTPSISANGTSNGIVWAVEGNGMAGVLHAYDATNLSKQLYSSGTEFAGNKFITPMIAEGKVYVGTPTGVVVFGLRK